MPKTKAKLLSTLDHVIDKLKDGIQELDELLDDMKEAGMRTGMYETYIVDHIKAVVSEEYGFVEQNNLDAMSEDIRKLPDEGCSTDEDDEDDE